MHDCAVDRTIRLSARYSLLPPRRGVSDDEGCWCRERATLKQVLALAYVKDGLRVESPVIPGAQALAVSRQIELQKTVSRQMQVGRL